MVGINLNVRLTDQCYADAYPHCGLRTWSPCSGCEEHAGVSLCEWRGRNCKYIFVYLMHVKLLTLHKQLMDVAIAMEPKPSELAQKTRLNTHLMLVISLGSNKLGSISVPILAEVASFSAKVKF